VPARAHTFGFTEAERAADVNAKRLLLASFFSTTLLNPLANASKKHIPGTPIADIHLMPRTSVPVGVYQGYLVVVSGQIGGEKGKQNFVIDTGTSPSMLNLRVAHKMGLPVTDSTLVAVGTKVQIGRTVLPQLELGLIHATDVHMNVMDLSWLEQLLSMPIAGLVGMDLLSQASFRLDYDSRELQFGDVDDMGIPVRYDRRTHLALADATVQGQPVRLVVDTGTDMIVVYGHTWETLASATKVVSLPKSRSVAAPVLTGQIVDPQLELDGVLFHASRTFYVPSAAAKGYEGIVGVTALKLHGLSFNQQTQSVRLLN
jgi:predicted aspartyl protease